jgi:hypothetical protein
MAAPAPTPASFRTVLRLGLVFDPLDDMFEPPTIGVLDNCQDCSSQRMASVMIRYCGALPRTGRYVASRDDRRRCDGIARVDVIDPARRPAPAAAA